MHEDAVDGHGPVSRRRMLATSGTIGLGTLLAACGVCSDDTATVTTTTGDAATIQPTTSTASTSGSLVDQLDGSRTCTLASEQTQGPYWFDVDAIRRDITEGRPGTPLELVLRVHDASNCDADGKPTPVADAVVEIWHCDAGGIYSGFEAASRGQGGGQPGGTARADASAGSYSVGEQQATPTDESRYLRGAQVSNDDGVVRFSTIYPGWYQGRTVHIHVKVHVNKTSVLTTQLYFDESLTSEVYRAAPYAERTGRGTFNDNDGIYDASGLVTVTKQDDGLRGLLNLGIAA